MFQQFNQSSNQSSKQAIKQSIFICTTLNQHQRCLKVLCTIKRKPTGPIGQQLEILFVLPHIQLNWTSFSIFTLKDALRDISLTVSFQISWHWASLGDVRTMLIVQIYKRATEISTPAPVVGQRPPQPYLPLLPPNTYFHLIRKHTRTVPSLTRTSGFCWKFFIKNFPSCSLFT